MARAVLEQLLSRLPPEFSAEEARQVLADDFHFRAPLKKLQNLERTGAILRLKRGVYAFRDGFDPLGAANVLHSPSYVSFETALGVHGVIPERVSAVLSVVDGRSARFDTPHGIFEYRSQQRPLYAPGCDWIERGERHVLMATLEKSLLDTLAHLELRAAKLSPPAVVQYVLESLRLDEDALSELSMRKLGELAPHYRNLAPVKFVQGLKARRRGQHE